MVQLFDVLTCVWSTANWTIKVSINILYYAQGSFRGVSGLIFFLARPYFQLLRLLNKLNTTDFFLCSFPSDSIKPGFFFCRRCTSLSKITSYNFELYICPFSLLSVLISFKGRITILQIHFALTSSWFVCHFERIAVVISGETIFNMRCGFFVWTRM